MHFIDIIIAIPLAIFIWKGWHKGIIFELAQLAGLVLGIWASAHFSANVAEWLNLEGDSAVLIGFFVTFIIVLTLVHLLGKALTNLLKMAKLGFANKLLGAIVGMLECVCILSVLIYYVEIIDKHERLITHETKTESVLYQPVNKTGNLLIGNIKELVNEVRENHLNNNDESDSNDEENSSRHNKRQR